MLKKLLSALLSLVLAMGLVVPGVQATPPSGTNDIYVENSSSVQELIDKGVIAGDGFEVDD